MVSLDIWVIFFCFSIGHVYFLWGCFNNRSGALRLLAGTACSWVRGKNSVSWTEVLGHQVWMWGPGWPSPWLRTASVCGTGRTLSCSIANTSVTSLGVAAMFKPVVSCWDVWLLEKILFFFVLLQLWFMSLGLHFQSFPLLVGLEETWH